MEEKMNTKKIIIYTVIAYALAWLLQIPASLYAIDHPGMLGNSVFRIVAGISMFAPLIAALIVNKGLKGMGWGPKIKGNVKWIIWAVVIAAIIVFAGAALFFLIFPDLFDTTGSYLAKTGQDMGVDIMAQLEEKGFSYMAYVIYGAVAAFTYGGLINMFFAVGEEAGWRGFLYQELKKGFGRIPAWIIGGIIWSVFHFPIIIIAGYEYGTDYIGAPVLGLVVFTINCIVMGALHDIIYEKTKCIWFPALFHGVINAAAAIPLMFWNVNSDGKAEKYMIFGPAANGLIGMIPMVIITVVMTVIVIKGEKRGSEQ